MEEKKLYNAVRKEITLADGRVIEIETGKLAKQADGSVVVKMGGTMLLGTVVAAKDAKPTRISCRCRLSTKRRMPPAVATRVVS